MRLDSKRLAKIHEAEDSLASRDRAFEPVSNLDKLPPALSVLRVYISQVASNRVFKDGHQELKFTFQGVISADQVGILRGHQDSRVDCLIQA